MYFTESSHVVQVDMGSPAIEIFRFTLLVHPSIVETPELVLDGYECRVDGELTGWYERNSPASLNRLTEQEVMEYDNYTSALLSAVQKLSDQLLSQFMEFRDRNGTPKPMSQTYVALRKKN
jgi:hypothetical protein